MGANICMECFRADFALPPPAVTYVVAELFSFEDAVAMHKHGHFCEKIAGSRILPFRLGVAKASVKNVPSNFAVVGRNKTILRKCSTNAG